MALDRHLICGGLLLVLLAWLLRCALEYGPDPARGRGVAGLPIVPADVVRRAEELDRLTAQVLRRGEAKRAAARDLAEGRLTLLKAAARLRDLDRQDPAFDAELFRLRTDGATDDERHCRQVIKLIGAVLPPQSAAREEVVRRCRAELRERVERGTLRLPGPE